MRLAVFDLDGTLTSTTGVDDSCFVAAVGEALGVSDFSLDWADYEHATDEGLVDGICRQERERGGLGRAPSGEEVARTRHRFIELLREAAAKEPGRFLAVPGAEGFIRSMGKGWTASVATGSWPESALIKVRASGIAGLLEGPEALAAAFAGRAEEGCAMQREEIVRLAVSRAAARAGATEFERVVCVGDGVWDLRAARRLGYGFVGVGRGPAQERLMAEGARVVLPDFLERDLAMRAMEEAEEP